MKHISVILITALLTTSCITYRNFPVHKINKPPKKESTTAELHYKIYDRRALASQIFGGTEAFRKALRKDSIFDTLVEVKKNMIPQEGLFVRVIIDQVYTSKAAWWAGFFSLHTATVIPAWSTQGGYNIRMDLFKNGKFVRNFKYRINRHWFAWIGMLPFVWVNLMTYSEKDAFRATLYQFMDDLKPHVTKKII